ncbi:hypothetical protein C8R43DRAFT_951572 [Mycena crocata]|nr:hypothetical protein C8R43DRAFT_951572 [Mycena crocata]
MALRPSLAEGATLLFLRGQRPCRGAVPGIFGILCALFTSYPSRIIGVADYLCFEPPPFSLHTLLLSADYSPKCNINPTTPSVFECATSSEMSTAVCTGVKRTALGCETSTRSTAPQDME